MSAVLVALFVMRPLRFERPLLDMLLFHGKVLVAASVATFCLGGALTGNSILAPLFLQTVLNQSATVTARTHIVRSDSAQ
jgi:hypothetical protein